MITQHHSDILSALRRYQLDAWGNQYFGINPDGHLVVYPEGNASGGVDLKRIVEEVAQSGYRTPVLIRFQDLIRHRVIALNEAFRQSIHEFGYKGRYQGVYPIKVNQLREVVEEILDAGRPYDFGLEAGSKAELSAVIALPTTEKALILCNGFKDEDTIRLAMLGIKMGKRVILVVEKLSELYQTLEIAEEMQAFPEIGLRLRLNARGSGRWEASSGEGAKFGLSTPEILEAVRALRRARKEHALKLVHFHIGSQITDIRHVKDAVKEATRFYAKLQKMGLAIEFIDVGGGLGVDYDGSRTQFSSSMNYTLSEYVQDVVYSIQEVCLSEGVSEPHIVSETGRALVAHHSILVVDVFGAIPPSGTLGSISQQESEHSVVQEMRYLLENIQPTNLLENLHDAQTRKEEGMSLFRLGFLSLEDRALVEQLYVMICQKIWDASRGLSYVSEEIEALQKRMSHQYLCNFSIFQSMPDHWAIQQLFPVLPIHRLLEEPTQATTLVDITCDSDGKMAQFIDLKDVKDLLPLHRLKPDEPYYIGFFLLGAYQDIMGDLHNLFGRVNEAHVFLDETEPHGYYVEKLIPGQTIAGILAGIQYSPTDLENSIKLQLDSQVRNRVLKPKEAVDLQRYYERVMRGYTYIQAGPRPSPLQEYDSLLQFA
jgi:arginine decarboxylase